MRALFCAAESGGSVGVALKLPIVRLRSPRPPSGSARIWSADLVASPGKLMGKGVASDARRVAGAKISRQMNLREKLLDRRAGNATRAPKALIYKSAALSNRESSMLARVCAQ